MPPTREEREKCYEARDFYFKCLDVNDSDKSSNNSICAVLNRKFNENCLKSWVEHFENEREKEIQRKQTVKRLEKQRNDKDYLERLIRK